MSSQKVGYVTNYDHVQLDDILDIVNFRQTGNRDVTLKDYDPKSKTDEVESIKKVEKKTKSKKKKKKSKEAVVNEMNALTYAMMGLDIPVELTPEEPVVEPEKKKETEQEDLIEVAWRYTDE